MNMHTLDSKRKQTSKLNMYNTHKEPQFAKTINTSSQKLVKLHKHLKIDLKSMQQKLTTNQENKN